MFERFTDRARKVMALANQEAQRFNHEYIGTEHILLGLVKEGSGVGANVLKNLDVDLRKVRLEVEKLVKSGPETVTMGKLHRLHDLVVVGPHDDHVQLQPRPLVLPFHLGPDVVDRPQQIVPLRAVPDLFVDPARRPVDRDPGEHAAADQDLRPLAVDQQAVRDD